MHRHINQGQSFKPRVRPITPIIMNKTPIEGEMMALARAMGRLIIARNSQSVREIEVTLSLVQRFPNYFEMLLKLLRIREFKREIKKLATVMINNFVKDHLMKDCQDLGSYSRKLVASLKDPDIDFSLKSNLAVALANIIKKDEKRQYFHMLLSALKSHLDSGVETIHLDLCVVLGRAIIQSNLLEVQEVAPILDKFIEMTLTAKQCLRNKVETFDVASLCQMQQWSYIRSQRIVQLISLLISIFDLCDNDQLSDPFRLCRIVRIVPVSQHSRILFSEDPTQNNKIHQNLSHLKSVAYNLLSIIIKKCSNAASGDVGDVNRKVSSIVQEIMSGLSGLFIYQSQYSQGIVMEHILQSQLNFLCHLYTSTELSKLLLNYDLTILRIISRILEYSHQQIILFINEPVQFNNHIVEIIDAKAKSAEQSEEPPLLEVVSFKVRAAQLLVQIGMTRPALCNKILEELVISLVKFTREGKECINPLLMLNILCKFANHNQIAIIGAALEMSLRMVPPSIFQGNERTCVQYALNLVTLSTFIREVNHHQASILQSLLVLAVELISDPCYFQVYQILGCELIESLYDLSISHIWLIKEGISMMLEKMKAKLQSRSVTTYLLDGIFHFIHNGSFSMDYCFILEETMRTTARCIESQVAYEDYKRIIVNKSWNILRSTIERYLPLNRPNRLLEQILTPLIEYYAQTLKGDYEEDCFLLMAMLIQSRKAVSNFVLEIYRIITLVFYTQYQGRFGLSFHALQSLIYFGSATLILKKDMLKQVKQMCLYSIGLQNQENPCQGVLLLQSLVMSLKEHLEGQNYHEILEQIQKRYLRKKANRPLYALYLAGLQGLCFAFSNSLWTSPQALAVTIRQMVEQSRQTCDNYFLRVIFISICEIALKLSFSQLSFYAEECVELFKLSYQLLDRRIETKQITQSDIAGLKEGTINMAKDLNVMAYLKTFLRKLEKVHERVFEQVMEATEWKYRLKELMEVENMMIG